MTRPSIPEILLKHGRIIYLSKPQGVRCHGCEWVTPIEADQEERRIEHAHHILDVLHSHGYGDAWNAYNIGHQDGFWNGRETAGNTEMTLAGVEHAKHHNPYPGDWLGNHHEPKYLVIPRPHVPYGPEGIPEVDADVDYLTKAAKDLEQHYKPFGSNLRATIVKLIRDTAKALEGNPR